MKTISIDIETYSGTDLNKCGVYKYTEDPNFEVLLFGYAVDGGEVHVVDLALGEKIPADIAVSLTDENVLKFAFNANFERVCLSRHLGLPWANTSTRPHGDARWCGRRTWDCRFRCKVSARF